MEGTPALLPKQQAAWLGCFRGIIFDDVCGLQGFTDLADGNFTLEHSLQGVGAE